jgi:hypothetical protein
MSMRAVEDSLLDHNRFAEKKFVGGSILRRRRVVDATTPVASDDDPPDRMEQVLEQWTSYEFFCDIGLSIFFSAIRAGARRD